MLQSYTEIALIATTFVISIKFLYLIRKRWKVDTPCWFCSAPNRVTLEQKNAFNCFKCLQYNGFKKDGGYNNPEIERKQRTNTNTRFCMANHHNSYSLLCQPCNKKQELIVKKINKFEAKNEKNWQTEYQQYRNQLESEHPLCPRCMLRSTVTIQKQKLDLSQPIKPSHQSSRDPLKPLNRDPNDLLQWRNQREDSVDRNVRPEFEDLTDLYPTAASLRESTPSRELAPSLSGISLSSDDLDDSISVRARRTSNTPFTPPVFNNQHTRSIVSGSAFHRQPSLFSAQRSYAHSVASSIREPEGLNRNLIVLCIFFALTAIGSISTLFYLISRLKLA